MISSIGNKPAHDFQTAFTLIELILVVVLLGVLVGLSTPLFKKSFSNLQLRNSAEKLAGLINYAQESAVVEKKDYCLNFEFNQGRFWLNRCSLADYEYVCLPVEGKYGKVFQLGLSQKFITEDKEDLNQSRLCFYPDGSNKNSELKINSGKDTYLLKIGGIALGVEIISVRDE